MEDFLATMRKLLSLNIFQIFRDLRALLLSEDVKILLPAQFLKLLARTSTLLHNNLLVLRAKLGKLLLLELPLMSVRKSLKLLPPSIIFLNIQDVWESTDEGKRKFAAACFQLRLAAREALASGRASRGEDNPSPLTAPWYRFGEAPKAINRLAFVLALTGGKIASTTSPQVSQAFGVDQQGFHVYMDQEVSFEMLFAKLVSSGHLENDGLTLKEKVFVQLNVLGNDTNFPFEKTFNFLAKNSWNFGWAIHDGRIFVSRSGGNPPVLLPKMLAQIAAVNNLRTLHAHVPYINIVDRGVLDAWYGKMNLTMPLPAGTFSGHTINIDLAMFDQERK